jgi:hypothetical protein
MTTADAHDAVELAEYIAIALGCSACPSTARHSARARVMSPRHRLSPIGSPKATAAGTAPV